MKIIDFGLSDFIRPGITSTQGSCNCEGYSVLQMLKSIDINEIHYDLYLCVSKPDPSSPFYR